MLQYYLSEELIDLIDRIQRTVAVDKIFLLGIEGNGVVSSVFCQGMERKGPVSAYHLLLLTREGEKRNDDVIVDMLEQRNKHKIPIHLMVYPVKVFYQWLKNAQRFALIVIEEAPLLFDSGITSIPKQDISTCDQIHCHEPLIAFQRSESFLVAAELFLLRLDFSMAAFNLHQAAEHACLSFLLREIGLRSNTHNIDKLLRYSTLITQEMNQLFPRNTDAEKELFRLLQRAYIHSRYKEYFITKEQVQVLVERVKKIQGMVSILSSVVQ